MANPTLKTIIFIALAILTHAHPHAIASCPTNTSTIIHDHLTISSSGNIVLQKGTDALCYSYTLAKPFQNKPGVAIAVKGLEAQSTNDLFFSVRYAKSDKLSAVDFLIRTQWKYTEWTLIEFSFIAEDLTNIEANSFNIDTASLAGCSQVNQVNVILPFKTQGFTPIKAFTFLNGFEISSITNLGSNTPFEVQVINVAVVTSGVSLSITVTSATKVFNIFLSLIAYDSTFQNAFSGNYETNNYFPTSTLSAQLSFSLQNNILDFYGFNGFIIGNTNANFKFGTQISVSTGFTFTTSSSFQYLSYNYFFVNAPICSLCNGYPLLYSGACYDKCPEGTFFMDNKCISCPDGKTWNGNECVDICKNGMVWNQELKSCVCPQSLYWNGSVCVSCTGGQVWSSQANSCVCPQSLYWNGSVCVSCTGGQVWSSQANSCVCPQSLYWNGSVCVSCTGGQVWSSQANSCVCPQSLYWNGSVCVSCTGGQVWSSQANSCVCPQSLYWNGSVCVSCTGGRIWCHIKKQCRCPDNQYWSGLSCVSCTGGQIWNPILNTCSCKSGFRWNGTCCVISCPPGQTLVNGICQCLPPKILLNHQCVTQPDCPSGTKWNGTGCNPISCPPGTSWNGVECSASDCNNCPPGTYWNGVVCSAITNQCPSGTVWNGNFCVTNNSQCPNGTFWNGNSCQALQCQCPAGMSWINNQCVLTNSNVCPIGTYFNGQNCQPYTPCTNGRVWNSQLVQCVCPQNSFWNGKTCVNCGNGQIYDGTGCFCPIGLVFNGSQCVPICYTQCQSISNGQWDGSKCTCINGYTFQDQKCVCKGLESDGSCDQCYAKPNSKWVNNLCKCNPGFYENLGQCEPVVPNPNPTPSSICNVATFFDYQQKKCLTCSDGCLSCTTCYSCTQCRPQYNYNPKTSLCNQICGDGKRFSLACDDGNNKDGDGCSKDCRIESGYSCIDGSPNSADVCSSTLPSALIFSLSGQSHLMNRIILNVRLNYLPQKLIKSAKDCKNNCDSVLNVQIVKGDKGVTSIKSSYIPSSTYSFSVEMDFGREPIGLFSAEIGIQPDIASKYFSGIDTSNILKVDINPAFMSKYMQDDKKKDSL